MYFTAIGQTETNIPEIKNPLKWYFKHFIITEDTKLYLDKIETFLTSWQQ